MSNNRFAADSVNGPAGVLFAVTPGAGNLAFSTIGLYIGGAGDVVVEDLRGQQVTFKNVPAGSGLPIRVNKVLAATTATNIVGMA